MKWSSGVRSDRHMFRLLLIAIAMMLVLAACSKGSGESGSDRQAQSQTRTGNGGSQTGTPSPNEPSGIKTGGTLKIGVAGGNLSNLGFIPQFRGNVETLIGSTTLETLTRFDEKGSVVPWLAKSWETDPNGKTITYVLKEGVKFHDGTDFNAEAVKWNVELAINEKAADLADIASVEVLDSRTVRIHLKQWNSGMLDTITNFLYIVSPSAYEQNGGKEWAYKHPVGTGPFKFVSWETDVSVKFEKFDQYWQEGKPHLDAVEWMIFQDPMTAAASMQVGEIDVFAFVTAQVLPDLRDKANIVMLQSGLGAGQDGIITSSRDPNSPFHDVRVRKAVGHAIDVDAILEAIMLGYAIPTNQWGTPNVWSYNPDVKGTPYDPEKARQLLAEAGYPDGFKTTIYSQPNHMQTFTAIQSYLAAVGIQADIVPVDAPKQAQLVSPEGGWDGIVYFTFRGGEPNMAQYAGRYFAPNASRFGAHIVNPEKVLDLIDQAIVAPDNETRTRLTHELQAAVWDEFALATPLWVNPFPAAIKDYVKEAGFNETNGHSWRPWDAYLDK